MIHNWFFFVSSLATFGCFLVYLFFLIPRQTQEVLKPLDGLTRLRWQILGILLLIAFTLIPSILYQGFVGFGHEYRHLRNVVSIVSRVNLVGLTVLFVMIYVYRRSDDL